MLRAIHRWPGLLAALLLALLGLSGAALSLFPALSSASLPQGLTQDLTLAELAAQTAAANPGLTELDLSPSGQLTAWTDGALAPLQIDPATGSSLGPVTSSALETWLIDLHRALFLSDAGRILMATAAAALLALAVSGLMLMARRAGGWRRILAPQRGLHAQAARLAFPGLALSALTALWMTAATFGLLPQSPAPAFPTTSGQTGAAFAAMPALQIPATEMIRLTFPLTGDASDVFTLQTDAATTLIDQGTGASLSVTPQSWADRLTRWMTMLHTGRGMAWMGLLLGLSALAAPLLAWTGARQSLTRPRRPRSAPAAHADVLIYVASEGGTTWGFAETLRAALTAQGRAPHVAPLSAFDPDAAPKAACALILAATHGDGQAPTGAEGILPRLAASQGAGQGRRIPLAILGFGDRSFADFCGFAHQLQQAATEAGWDTLLPLATVDRQSPQDFARWGRDLGRALGLSLDLIHHPERPQAQALTLISRRDYGQAVQAPTAILRFALPALPLWRRALGQGWSFRAGDLLGILPQGSDLPRFYSLASGHADGFVEICVRKHPGGLASGQLCDLQPGQSVQAFLRANRGFQPAPGRAPVILIGAGTGLGPLAGFARANAARRPMHLFLGLRHPTSDLLYEDELKAWLDQGRLTTIRAAFSRLASDVGQAPLPRHVQDSLRAEAPRLRALIGQGAQILVCGGRDMAQGVREALAEILSPLALSPANLKAEGRYAEDIY